MWFSEESIIKENKLSTTEQRQINKCIRPLFPYPALLLTCLSKKILVATDLHIGFERALAEKGVYLPSQTSKISKKMIHVLTEYKPDELILLGDVKQAIPKISLREENDVLEFFDNITNHVKKLTIILGNHDGGLTALIPPLVDFIPATGVVMKTTPKIGLVHGHAWPKPEVLASDILVMGHIHPLVRFYDAFGFTITRQAWMKIKCKGETLAEKYLEYRGIKTRGKTKKKFFEKFRVNIKNPQVIVLPAFNDALGGVPVNTKKPKWIGPILRNCDIENKEAEIYLLDGAYLGTISSLPTQP